MTNLDSYRTNFNFNSFKEIISLSNFTNVLLDDGDRQILTDTELHSNGLYDDLRNQFFNTIIDRNIVETTFYENLNTNIFYHEFNYDVKNKIKMNKIMDIDMSFYAHNKIKVYMFYLDFLAEYYRNLAELKNNKHVLKNEIFKHEFNIKVRIVPTAPFIDNYISVSKKINDTVTDKKNYINVNFTLENVNNNLDLTNIAESGIIFKTITIDKDLTGNYVRNIRWLFNKISITNELSIVNELDYNHLIGLSYKYRFYRLLLDYYVLIIYYIYIRFKKENPVPTDSTYNKGGSLKYGEIRTVLENFNIVFQNYIIKLMKLTTIMESVNTDNRLPESEKIAESVEYKEKLKKINKEIDIRNNNLNQYATEINNGNFRVNNAKKTFWISLITLIISIFIYLSIINTSSVETSRIVSTILLIFIIITYIIFNYILTNRYNETFNTDEEAEPASSMQVEPSDYDGRIHALEQSLLVSDNTSTDLTELVQTQTAIFDSLDALQNEAYTEWGGSIDESGLENTMDHQTLLSQAAETGIASDNAATAAAHQEYLRNLGTMQNIDLALTTYIGELEGQLTGLNARYVVSTTEHADVLIRRDDILLQLQEVRRLHEISSGNQGRMDELIMNLDSLLDDYLEIEKNLYQKRAQTSELKELLVAKALELSTENGKLASQIHTASQTMEDNEDTFNALDLELKKIIRRNTELSVKSSAIAAEILKEDALSASIHAQVQTGILEYREYVLKEANAALKLSEFMKDRDDGNLEIQKYSQKIIDLQEKATKSAETARFKAVAATEEAKDVLIIIQEKIAAIALKEARQVPIILKMDLNLNYKIVESNDTFNDKIIQELSNAIIVSPNRFELLDVKEGDEGSSIMLKFKIYQNRTFDTTQLTHTQIADNIITQSQSNDTPIKITKYLRFVKRVGIVDREEDLLTDAHNVTQPLNYNYETVAYTMTKNATDINEILRYITTIEGLYNKNRSYYDEVNPYLRLEVRKFENINNTSNTQKKILQSNYNSTKHSVIYNDNLSKLFIYITLLIGIVFVLQSYFDNNIGFINIIGIIIFSLIIIYYFINILKPVRTQVNNYYWGTPKSHLKRIN